MPYSSTGCYIWSRLVHFTDVLYEWTMFKFKVPLFSFLESQNCFTSKEQCVQLLARQLGPAKCLGHRPPFRRAVVHGQVRPTRTKSDSKVVEVVTGESPVPTIPQVQGRIAQDHPRWGCIFSWSDAINKHAFNNVEILSRNSFCK